MRANGAFAMDWTDKRVLVTGAGGFIGSSVVEALVTRGARVTAFIRYKGSGDEGALAFLPPTIRDTVTVVAGDVADPATAAALVMGHGVVFHLAALVGIPYSYIHPLEVVQTNTVGTAYLLEACRQQGIERLVCFSTSEVYGTARYAPIDEEHPLQAQSPYAASKIGSDQLALSYFRSFGLPVAIARPFNTYGPRQSSRAVIPTIITQALRGGPVRLGSVTPTRDLCYVGDTAEGVIRIAESEITLGEVINLGTGSEISIGALASRIFALLGREPNIITDEQRVRPEKSEVMRLIADRSKAKRLVGWEPRVSLDEGLERTITWVRANPGFFKVSHYHV
jgi:NAD dependent epimerase/dehydratase